MDKVKIFKYIKAEKFFPDYLPEIKNYKRKISGKNGRGNPVDFTPQEERQIKKAIKEMVKDFL